MVLQVGKPTCSCVPAAIRHWRTRHYLLTKKKKKNLLTMCTRKENQWISCLNWFFPPRYLVLDRQTFQNLIIQIKVNQLKKHCLKREILVAPVAKLFPSLKTPVPLRAQSHSIKTFTDGDVEAVTGLSVQREQRSNCSSPPHTALRSGSLHVVWVSFLTTHFQRLHTV